MSVIHVAVGIIYNYHNQILIAKRPDDKHLGGLWEFPGGKLEAQESPLEALKRELKEELEIDVLSSSPLTTLEFSYPAKDVLLNVWRVTKFSGVPQGAEGQTIRWIHQNELPCYNFPKANEQIFEFL